MDRDTKDMFILGCFASIAIFGYTLLTHDVPKTRTYYESHTVQKGETLSEIVLDHHGSLIRTQGINSNVIMPGEKIQVVIEQ